MSARTFSGTRLPSWRESDVMLSLLAFGFCGLATFALLREFDGKPLLLPLAFGAALAIGLFCLLSTRYTLTLGALMLFLGLADGYLKLRFGGLAITALRDALLFSVAAGALMRLALSREQVRWPPLTVLVVAWVAVVLVQLANPANGTLTHSLLSLRSHIEWVPLFFFGYVMMRDKRRIFAFLTILLVITTINGAVSLYQYEAGPAAIAAWGPGYEKVIFGGPQIAGRTFIDADGTQRLRPPGLGSDTGYAGVLAVIAGPAAFVFLMLGRRRLLQFIGGLFIAGVLVAVLTAQIRIALIGLAIGMLAVVALSVASRKIVQVVVALGVAAVVAITVGSAVSGRAGAGIFDRYALFQNTHVVSTSTSYKKGTLALLPESIVKHPFGDGFGSVGAAASIAGAPAAARTASGESELNFLLVDVGVPGLLVMLAFQLTVIVGSARAIRRLKDVELRLLLSALLAPLVAVGVLWFAAPVTGAPPLATYLWFSSGVLTYWCFGRRDELAGLNGIRPKVARHLHDPAAVASRRPAGARSINGGQPRVDRQVLAGAPKRALHIGMLTTSLPEPDRKPGGVDILIHRLANHLVESGHRVTIYTYSPKPSDARYHVHGLAPQGWRRRKIQRMFCVPVAWNRLALHELDVLHIHGDDWFYLRRTKPTVRTFYGSALDEMQTATRWRRRASQGLVFLFELLAARLATTTYGLIPGDGRWYRTVGHLGCGIDAAKAVPRATVPTVLFVGTWTGRKRGRELAAAFEAHVLPAMPGARLIMASDEAPDVPWIEHLPLPTDEELRRRFGESWVFCLPSSYEGLGIPYLEAMAAGTPVLATPNPGARYLLGGGAHGMIVELPDLGTSLRDLLADAHHRSELASAGRTRAREFSWQAVCDAHVAAYEDAIMRWGR